jgi:hypothetical protein
VNAAPATAPTPAPVATGTQMPIPTSKSGVQPTNPGQVPNAAEKAEINALANQWYNAPKDASTGYLDAWGAKYDALSAKLISKYGEPTGWTSGSGSIPYWTPKTTPAPQITANVGGAGVGATLAAGAGVAATGLAAGAGVAATGLAAGAGVAATGLAAGAGGGQGLPPPLKGLTQQEKADLNKWLERKDNNVAVPTVASRVQGMNKLELAQYSLIANQVALARLLEGKEYELRSPQISEQSRAAFVASFDDHINEARRDIAIAQSEIDRLSAPQNAPPAPAKADPPKDNKAALAAVADKMHQLQVESKQLQTELNSLKKQPNIPPFMLDTLSKENVRKNLLQDMNSLQRLLHENPAFTAVWAKESGMAVKLDNQISALANTLAANKDVDPNQLSRVTRAMNDIMKGKIWTEAQKESHDQKLNSAAYDLGRAFVHTDESDSTAVRGVRALSRLGLALATGGGSEFVYSLNTIYIAEDLAKQGVNPLWAIPEQAMDTAMVLTTAAGIEAAISRRAAKAAAGEAIDSLAGKEVVENANTLEKLRKDYMGWNGMGKKYDMMVKDANKLKEEYEALATAADTAGDSVTAKILRGSARQEAAKAAEALNLAGDAYGKAIVLHSKIPK